MALQLPPTRSFFILDPPALAQKLLIPKNNVSGFVYPHFVSLFFSGRGSSGFRNSDL